MRNKLRYGISIIALVLTVMFAFSVTAYAKTVKVKGYFRKDGTYVKSHYRTSPDSSVYNNWSTIGNVNPYTGEPGTIDPNNISSKSSSSTSSSSSSYSTKDSNTTNTVTTTSTKAKSLDQIAQEILGKSTKSKEKYFTIGSTPDDVKKVMGEPSYSFKYLKIFEYGTSTVYFDDDWKVSYWSNSGKNLLVYLGEVDANDSAFTYGSSVEDVIKANGTPDSISNSYIKKFYYRDSVIYFDDNWKVEFWVDYSNILKVK